jgi:hypothetical protein
MLIFVENHIFVRLMRYIPCYPSYVIASPYIPLFSIEKLSHWMLRACETTINTILFDWALACKSWFHIEGVPGTYFSTYPTKIWEDPIVTKLKLTSWSLSWMFSSKFRQHDGREPSLIHTHMYKSGKHTCENLKIWTWSSYASSSGGQCWLTWWWVSCVSGEMFGHNQSIS